jgi:hypothetical protein
MFSSKFMLTGFFSQEGGQRIIWGTRLGSS